MVLFAGHYDVFDLIWVNAHWHQFANPGWRFLAVTNKSVGSTGGSDFLADGGSYVTLVPPASAVAPAYPPHTFTMIIETLDGAGLVLLCILPPLPSFFSFFLFWLLLPLLLLLLPLLLLLMLLLLLLLLLCVSSTGWCAFGLHRDVIVCNISWCLW
jgi:hypothetical protein